MWLWLYRLRVSEASVLGVFKNTNSKARVQENRMENTEGILFQ